MIPLNPLTILKLPQWQRTWKPLVFSFLLLFTLSWQTVTAQQFCPAPAFLPALTVDGPLGTVICESEDVSLSVTVEGGFPLMGTACAVSINRLYQIDLSDPYTAPTLVGGPYNGFFFTGGDLINDEFYVLDYFNNGLYTIDSDNGTLSGQIGTTTPQAGERWSGLALDPTTGLAYAISKSATNTTLYSLDYVNGAVTVIGSTGFSGGEWLAIDNDGNAFAATANTLYSLDLATGNGIAVGPTVINSNSSAQSADFDPATGLQFNFAHQQFTNNRLFNLGNTQTGEFNPLQQQTTGQLVFTALGIPGNQTALYNYAWSTGETTEDIVVNAPGTYMVSVTDHCGTEVVESITVSQDVQNTSTSCNANINTGLGLTGTAVISPATVLEGENGCLEGYTVEIGNTGSNVADCSMIGQMFDVEVFDADGNSVCWNSGWTFEDKVEPVIECTNLSIACTDDYDPATMANTGVVATDNCTANPTLTYTEVENLGCDATGGFGTITRTWTATDEYGNSSSCTQTLTITRPTLADLVCPGNYDGMTNPVFECNGNWTQDDNGHPAPSVTGEPTLNNTTLDNVCMFDRTYSDQVFPNCGDAFDIVRTWTVIDWCNPDQMETCIQTIKVMDNTPPTLTCPANITDGAGNNCNSSVILPAPTALSDACSGDGLDYTIAHTSGTLVQQGSNNVLVGLELGVTTVTYTATDGCGNSNTCSFTITIIDDTNPPCIAISSTTLGLSGTGTTIPWTTFVDSGIDLATADNCGPVTVEVKRQDMSFCDGDESTAYGADVPFFCCDVGNVVLVDVKVTDGVGLENFCTVSVTIQDNLDPTITCPANKTISCENYTTALMTYDGVTPDADGIPDAGATDPLAYFVDGNGVSTFVGYYANAADNCEVTVTITDGFLQVDACGNSENAANVDAPFLRTYTVTDASGNTDVCTQEITIANPNPFNPATDVSFPPALLSIECSAIGSLAPATATTTDNCESAGVTLAQQLVVLPDDPSDPTNDFCFKLLRTWEAYDWCSDDPSTPVASFEQTVKINDNDAPVLGDCTPTATSVEVGENFEFNISATDCTDAYVQTPTTFGLPAVVFGYEIDQDNDGSVNATGVGTLSTVATGPGTDFPVGTHSVTFTATDYCGNVGSCTVIVTVTNTLDCDDFINPLIYEVNVGNNPSGTTISASNPALYSQAVDATGVLISLTNNDPNPQSTINFDCSDVTGNPIDVYFYLTTGEVCLQQIRPLDVSPPSLASCGFGIGEQNSPVGGVITFDFDAANPTTWIDASDICSGSNLTYSLSSNTYTCLTTTDSGNTPVTVSVTDQNGNTSSCVVQVPYDCGQAPPMNVVTGIIGNEENGLLANVNVSPASGMDVVTTDANGMFNMNLPTYENYEITPNKDDDYLNGVSTYDIVLMSKHLLGVEALDSPYKIIAADINKSGEISTLDMVLLRKLVLFIDTEFSNNTSWRFVDANYIFDNPIEPLDEDFPETYPINELNSDMQDIDFVAVKTGDVNGTAIVNLNEAADDRTFKGELQLNLEEQLLKAGETYKIDVKAKDFTEMLGYQFTIGFEQNAIEITDVVAGEIPSLDANNFNMQGVSEGVITTSWNQVEPLSLDDNTVLFTLEVNAKQDVKLSDVLNTNSRLTAAEAYRAAGSDVDLMNLVFDYTQSGDNAEAFNVFALYQNRPNPFKNETLITFSLPESGEAKLKIFDLSGKVIQEITRTFEKGYNELSINRSDLNASGVLYYELSTSKHTALQKMIVID